MADTSDKTAELRSEVLGWVAADYDGIAKRMESPIEALLYWALLREGAESGTPRIRFAPDPSFPSWFRITGECGDLVFHPQHELEVPGGKYRLDFYAVAGTTVPDIGNSDGKTVEFRAAIECDGHDFHERTKEQARRDRKRDRDIQAAGLRVLRFTGSEIYRDPCGAARDIIDTLNAGIWSLNGSEWDAYRAAKKAGGK